MYEKKRKKICPFCGGKIKKEYDKLFCGNCGLEIDRQAMDSKTRNMHFFNGHR